MNTAHPDFDKLHPANPNERAIVIGSGFGGLAAAIRLAAKGYHVTLLEKLDALGGRGYTYRQDGFTLMGDPLSSPSPSCSKNYGRSAAKP